MSQGVKGTGSAIARKNKWRANNPEAAKEAVRRWKAAHPGYLGVKRQAVVDFVRQYKEATPCVDCGQKFAACSMDFDHTGTKTGEVGLIVARSGSIEAVLAEMKMCELVCANCHRVRTRDRGSAGWNRRTKQ